MSRLEIVVTTWEAHVGFACPGAAVVWAELDFTSAFVSFKSVR